MPASQNSRRSQVLRGPSLTDTYPGRSCITHRTVHGMQSALERRNAGHLATPSSTQLSTTCVRLVGMAEAESLGAGAWDLKVLGRRPAAQARRAVTLAISSPSTQAILRFVQPMSACRLVCTPEQVENSPPSPVGPASGTNVHVGFLRSAPVATGASCKRRTCTLVLRRRARQRAASGLSVLGRGLRRRRSRRAQSAMREQLLDRAV